MTEARRKAINKSRYRDRKANRAFDAWMRGMAALLRDENAPASDRLDAQEALVNMAQIGFDYAMDACINAGVDVPPLSQSDAADDDDNKADDVNIAEPAPPAAAAAAAEIDAKVE